MELPVDEEDDEQVVRVPEPLKVSAAPLLNSKPHHDAKRSGHDPSSETRPSGEIGTQKPDKDLAGGRSIWVEHCELRKVHHVSGNVDERTGNNGPGGGFVEGDILVEGNDVVQGGSA